MEDRLKELLDLFYTDKLNSDKYKKSSEEYNKEIKEIMNELNINEFKNDTLVAKISTQKRESFIEDKLVETLQELGGYRIPGLIVLQPKVDMDKLEDAIYNGLIDAAKLSNCRQVKEVMVLKVNQRKDN